jgi:hypothetical protein
MRRWALRLGLAAVACAAVLEVGAATYFYWTTGRLIYLNRAPGPAAGTAEPSQNKPFKHRLHPYFGFAGTYDQNYGALHTNSLGFFQREPVTIPFTPTAGEFVVAVFGGSVADRLVLGAGGGVPLRESLQAVPGLASRKVVLLNLAQGAEKQPQQLLLLAYLGAIGQHVDFVVNIDGFNEFALGYLNHRAGLHPVLPAAQMMGPLALELSDAPSSARYYDLAGRVFAARNAAPEHSAAMRHARSGLALVSAYVQASLNRRALSNALREYAALVTGTHNWSSLKERLSLDLPHRAKDAEIFPMLFDLWLRSAQEMRLLSEARGAGYLHVVQPNQYFSKRSFSPRERSIALSLPPEHEYRRGVEMGYALLAERSATLHANGIVSATDLYDVVSDDVYSDNCCHYTASGETLLGQFVAGQVAQRLKDGFGRRP